MRSVHARESDKIGAGVEHGDVQSEARVRPECASQVVSDSSAKVEIHTGSLNLIAVAWDGDDSDHGDEMALGVYDMTGKRVGIYKGLYLDGNTFDFHGKVRTEAKLSQMVTGKKHIFLKAINPFFSKDGAGTEVPVKITGTKSEPHFGLDYRHKGEKEEHF